MQRDIKETKRLAILAPLLLIVFLGGLQIALFSGPVLAAPTVTNVSIQNIAYTPSSVTVVIGVNNTVTWKNNEVGLYAPEHSATADGGMFNSGFLSPGASFSFTFDQPGTFAYHCMVHASMHGTVIVKAQASTTTSSTSTSTSSTSSTVSTSSTSSTTSTSHTTVTGTSSSTATPATTSSTASSSSSTSSHTTSTASQGSSTTTSSATSSSSDSGGLPSYALPAVAGAIALIVVVYLLARRRG